MQWWYVVRQKEPTAQQVWLWPGKIVFVLAGDESESIRVLYNRVVTIVRDVLPEGEQRWILPNADNYRLADFIRVRKVPGVSRSPYDTSIIGNAVMLDYGRLHADLVGVVEVNAYFDGEMWRQKWSR